MVALYGLAVTCSSALLPAEAAGDSRDDGTLRVALVGQALIKQDLCTRVPESLQQARDYLSGANVAFTNLEVAIAPEGVELEPRSETVTPVAPVVLDCLEDMGFNLLSLANNHAADLGQEGIRSTRHEVAQRGFAFAGTGSNSNEAASAGYLDTPAGKVALVAMASGSKQLTPDTWATDSQPGVNFLELREDGTLNPQHKKRILEAVREAASRGALVIAYQHSHYWGKSSELTGPPGREPRVNRFDTPAWMESWARELVDAGARIFVAHGNPALHGIEVYRGGLILYGLGNYIFQSAGTPDKYGPLAYYSAVVDARFDAGNLAAVRITPLVLALDPPARGAPFLARGGEAEAVLGRLQQLSLVYGTELRIEGEWAEVMLQR